MLMLLLLIFLGLVFFFVLQAAALITTIVAIVVGVTAITTLAGVWVATSYYLKASGYEPKIAQQVCDQVDSDLKQVVGELQEIRFELEEVEPHLRNMEFLKYARQNRETEN